MVGDALVAAAESGIQAETIAAYCALAAAVLTPLFTAIAASRRQTVELEVPRLRTRVKELEDQRAADRRRSNQRIDELEEEITELRRYVYDLRQDIAAAGREPRAIPPRLRLANDRNAQE